MFSTFARFCANRHLLPGTLCFPLALATLPLWAAEYGHDHLDTSASLTFQEIFASALENTPEYLEAAVREGQAGDYAAAGSRWIAGQPSLQLNYYDDSTLDNVGLKEMEYGVQLPLWRPGQRSASRNLGQQYEAQVDAWKTDLAWVVAGRLRSMLADIARAELGMQLQERAVTDAQRLVNVTQTLFDAGEVARLELMQAQSLLAEKQADLLEADAEMIDAERAYFLYTGLGLHPAATHTEAQSPREEIGSDHPRLLYLRSSVDLALANVRQSENAAKGNPTLTIGSRRERGDQYQNYISSVGIQLSIPFGGGSYVSAQTSSARRARVDAEVEYQNALRRLNQGLHEVEHDLFILNQEEPLRRTQADLSRQRFDMALTAFEAGETTLAQAVIAQQEALESERALQTLLLQREKLITEYNQLIGILP